MSTHSIICSGNELDSVLAGIRGRGGVVTALATGVGGHNANYAVSYFDVGGPGRDARSDVGTHRTPEMGSNPMPSTKFPFACGDCDPCLGGRPDQCVIFPHKPQDASSGTMQSEPDLTLTVKGVRQVAGHITTKTSVAAGNDKRAEKPKSALDAPASISIEERLAALQSKLSAAGKIKRSKTREARLPHND